MTLTQSQIEKKLSHEHLEGLLELWQTEQGARQRRHALPSFAFCK